MSVSSAASIAASLSTSRSDSSRRRREFRVRTECGLVVARAIGVRHLSERKIFREAARRKIFRRAAEQREHRAAAGLGPARAACEVGRDFGAGERFLQIRRVANGVVQQHRDSIERHAASRLGTRFAARSRRTRASRPAPKSPSRFRRHRARAAQYRRTDASADDASDGAMVSSTVADNAVARTPSASSRIVCTGESPAGIVARIDGERAASAAIKSRSSALSTETIEQQDRQSDEARRLAREHGARRDFQHPGAIDQLRVGQLGVELRERRGNRLAGGRRARANRRRRCCSIEARSASAPARAKSREDSALNRNARALPTAPGGRPRAPRPPRPRVRPQARGPHRRAPRQRAIRRDG